MALALIERDGKGGVGAEGEVGGGALLGEEGGGADAHRIREVGRNLRQGGIARFRVEGDDGDGQVVAVDEGDVVEGLAGRGSECEFGQGDGGVALQVSFCQFWSVWRGGFSGNGCVWGWRGGGAADCESTIDYSTAVSRGTGPSATIVAPGVAWASTVRTEATVCPTPDASLPIGADGQISRLSQVESETLRTGCCARLREYSRIDDFWALVCDDEWSAFIALTDIL